MANENVTFMADWSPQPIHVLNSVVLGTLSINCFRVSLFTTVMSLNTVAEVLLLQGDIEKGYQLKTIFSHRMIYLNLTMPNKVPSGISY